MVGVSFLESFSISELNGVFTAHNFWLNQDQRDPKLPPAGCTVGRREAQAHSADQPSVRGFGLLPHCVRHVRRSAQCPGEERSQELLLPSWGNRKLQQLVKTCWGELQHNCDKNLQGLLFDRLCRWKISNLLRSQRMATCTLRTVGFYVTE